MSGDVFTRMVHKDIKSTAYAPYSDRKRVEWRLFSDGCSFKQKAGVCIPGKPCPNYVRRCECPLVRAVRMEDC